MLNKDDCYHIGYIAKSRGVEGEIVLRLEYNINDILEKSGSIFVDIDGGLVPFFFEYIESSAPNTSIALIQDYTQEDKIKRLLNKNIYIDKKLVKLKNDDISLFQNVNGYAVIDENEGEVGVAEEIVEYNGNTLLVVTSTDNREMLIPFTNDIILKINDKKKRININAPEGLLSLNVS